MSTTYNKFEDSSDDMNNHAGVPMQNVASYGYDQPASTTVVHVNQPYVSEPSFRWCHFVVSLILMIVNPCAWVFSLLALIYSANAYASHGEKAYEKSRRQNHLSMIFWIVSVVITGISLLVFIILVAKLVNTEEEISRNLQQG